MIDLSPNKTIGLRQIKNNSNYYHCYYHYFYHYHQLFLAVIERKREIYIWGHNNVVIKFFSKRILGRTVDKVDFTTNGQHQQNL